ncbi:MAG: chorismate mutase [SAR324 cluster bacterium]|nr:chorismate mutase [SAR324 cluster bacterium]
MAQEHDTDLIDGYRQEIDEIDTQLLRMLNRRAACALSIGKIKKRNNLPVFVPEREEQVMTRLLAENLGPVRPEAVRTVFQAIFSEMKSLEEAENGD